MDPSRSHRLAPDNTIQIVTFFFLCFELSFIKLLINTREKQELPGTRDL